MLIDDRVERETEKKTMTMRGGCSFFFSTSSSFPFPLPNQPTNQTQIRTLDVACVLVGGHSAPVTALAWAPDEDRWWRRNNGGGGSSSSSSSSTSTSAHPSSSSFSSSSSSSPLRIASGDAEGRVVVWDVRAGTQLARLDDVVLAATGSSSASAAAASAAAAAARERADSGTSSSSSSSPSPLALHHLSTGVRALAWGGPESEDTLLVLAAPGLLAAWSVPSSSFSSSSSASMSSPNAPSSFFSPGGAASGGDINNNNNNNSGTIRWRREFSPELRLACLTLDPSDPRTVCLHGEGLTEVRS